MSCTGNGAAAAVRNGRLVRDSGNNLSEFREMI